MLKVLLVYPNLQMVNLLPTNIGILTALLKQNNIDCKLFDTTLYKIDEESEDDIRVKYGHYKSSYSNYKQGNVYIDFVEMLYAYKPDVIAFSVVDSTWKLSQKLINLIDIKAHVICGGVMPMFAPDIVIENARVDSVCLGEGEVSLIELCKNIQNKKSILFINNLWVKTPNGICKNKMEPLVDINTLPYEDFSLFESERFLRPMQGQLKKMIPIMIDRGCPYKCSFCAEPQINKTYKKNNIGCNYRIKSMDNIKDYILYMVDKYKPEYLYFNSETFFARPESHIKEFTDFYINNINIPFCCMTRIETVTSNRMKMLKDMGCNRISFGIEHGNEDFRKKMLKKQFTNEDVYNSINIMNDTKIPATFFNMVGFPDETWELAKNTIQLNRWINKNYMGDKSFSISIFQPYYSTPLRQYCIKKGYINNDTIAGGLINDCVLNMPNFSAAKIISTAKRFVKLVNSI
jgi:radical SAM superfamily enzyme YgiQ (UPF0313 family)